jgi:cell volume regulation protein A
VGYSVGAHNPYLRRGLLPRWAKPALVVRDDAVLTPEEASTVRAGDYLYLLAPPEKARGLDRFFVNLPSAPRPDPRLLGDFFVSGSASLAELADIYSLQVAPEHAGESLADYFAAELGRPAKINDILLLGPIALLAHRVDDGRVTTVGLQLDAPDTEAAEADRSLPGRLRRLARRGWAALRG